MFTRLEFQEIQAIAQSIRNVYSIAEKTNYPFPSVKYPALKDVLNLVAKNCGFDSYVSLKHAFDQGKTHVFPEIADHRQEILEIIKKINPTRNAKEIAFHAINIFNEITRSPLSNIDSEIVSKFQCYKVNPLVSQLIDSIDSFDIGLHDSVGFILKKAIISVALQHKTSIDDAMHFKLKLSALMKTSNPKSVEHLYEAILALYKNRINHNDHTNHEQAISISKGLKEDHLSARVNLHNNNFFESLKMVLLKSLLVETMYLDVKNSNILKSILSDKKSFKHGYEIDINNELSAHESILYKINKELDIIYNAFLGDLVKSKIEQQKTLADEKTKYEINIDSTGLIHHKAFDSILYMNDMKRLSYFDYTDHIGFYTQKMTEEQNFWVVYLTVRDALEIKGEQEAVDYINYCYQNSNLTAYVERNIETDMFLNAYNNFSAVYNDEQYREKIITMISKIKK